MSDKTLKNNLKNGEHVELWDEPQGIQTLGVRAGYTRTQEREHNEAIFTTSSYVFESAEQAAAIFTGDEEGNIYTRFTNPTVSAFERRLAALEGAQACVATSSGMSAILSVCIALLEGGDHIVSSRSIFGSSITLFNKYMGKFGVATSYVDLTDIDSWESAMLPETKMLFLETPSNPLVEVADISAIAKLAHDNDCLLVVDNCLCTPALQQPLSYGADLVVHSATKYIDGQGRALGGAVLGDEKYIDEVFGVLRTTGPSMSPFNAWIFLKGLETLSLRMNQHCQNAMALAQWLSEQEKVNKVFYPGLADHAGHELAKKQQRLFGGVLSFEVKGGRTGAWNVINQTRLLSITANLGDAKTTITHPATTTHGRVDEEERIKAGITDGLIRIAVGIENVEDIISDLSRGLLS
ncbi:MAG: O-succinylhomoserine sulfhydrylase [Gammaproteobacteria bacterium]|nr:O-succinylhomoserine sulfhydrylase [Gammaproteobacteria bacterium]